MQIKKTSETFPFETKKQSKLFAFKNYCISTNRQVTLKAS